MEMSFLLQLLALVFVINTSQANIAPVDCPSGWISHGPYCYLRVKNLKATWKSAIEYCDRYGGNLVSILSEEENEFVNKLHADYLTPDQYVVGHWIGYSDENQANNFQWLDSSWGSLYSNWNKGEPNNKNGAEHCTEVKMDTGKWNNVICNSGFPKYFTCKELANKMCYEKDGWKKTRDHCYLPKKSCKTWQDAENDCKTLNSSLVSIHTQEENAFIFAMHEGWSWIGLQNLQLSSFHWSDGSSRIYHNWNDNEPTYSKTELCTEMISKKLTAGGRWNNLVCSKCLPYTCKKRQPNVCADDWVFSHGKCYRFYYYKKDWFAAEHMCGTSDSHQVNIGSFVEGRFIQDKFDEDSWIGLRGWGNYTYRFSDDRFSTLSYTNWDQVPSNSGPLYQCGHASSNYKWTIGSCSVKRFFTCEKDVDDCASSPCGNGGTCTDEVGSYQCQCAPGYSGDRCYSEIDECSSNPCVNGGQCVDKINDYECQCPEEFDGKNCQQYKCASGWTHFENNCYLPGTACKAWFHAHDICVSHESQLTSIQSDTENVFVQDLHSSNNTWIGLTDHYSPNTFCWSDGSTVSYTAWAPNEPSHGRYENCAVTKGKFNNYKWNDIWCVNCHPFTCEKPGDDCSSTPCQNGGQCSDKVNDYECQCVAGFQGKSCETDIDDCVVNKCLNGGLCVDKVNSYACQCAGGYSGTNCENHECDSSPCLNNGVCKDDVNGYKCECLDGYNGQKCETDIDECTSSPCANGGVCTDAVNSYTCTCLSGFTGARCETDVDECASSPCANGGVCTDVVNGYNCACAPGFTGVLCETNVDECASSPCNNGGVCQDGVNGYTCACAPGYSGAHCDTNIDECASFPCSNSGQCVDGINGYSCQCLSGFTGDHCQINIDECQSAPCQNGGQCTDLVDSYKCTCVSGYTGDNCQNDIDECASSPCQNGAYCYDQVDGYFCICTAGYNGTHCETKCPTGTYGYKCQSQCSCKNGADCNFMTGFCACTDGWLGKSCDIVCDDGKYGPYCSKYCTCQNGGLCDHVTGACTCGDDYTGINCEISVDPTEVPEPSKLQQVRDYLGF